MHEYNVDYIPTAEEEAHFGAEFDHYALGLMEWYRRPTNTSHLVVAVAATVDFFAGPRAELNLHGRAITFMDRSGTLDSLDELSRHFLITSTALRYACESGMANNITWSSVNSEAYKDKYVAVRASMHSAGHN